MFIDMFFADTNSSHWDMMSRLLQQGFYQKEDTLRYRFIEDTLICSIYTAPAYLKELSDGS